jgi:pyruvate dehydrogenase E1 component alpha subunit
MVISEKEKLLELYKTMLKIRRFEEKVAELFAKGFIPGFVHSYIGEEAIAAGVCANLGKDDYIMSTHRGHGHLISKGADMKRMMAELFGRETGYCRGHGGSMHIADLSVRILGATGIIGAGIPMAVGAGLSIKMKKSNNVSVVFFGDGANNQGVFHESLNLASIWKIPALFVCENNQYATTFHVSKSTAVKNIADRAIAYNMPGVVVNGNDVLEVYEAANAAMKRAREGKGPTLVECKTYRTRGHYEGDPQKYRAREEVEEWKKKCPIKQFKLILIEKGLLTDKEDQVIDNEIRKEVAEAVKYAKDSPIPSAEKMIDYLYA